MASEPRLTAHQATVLLGFFSVGAVFALVKQQSQEDQATLGRALCQLALAVQPGDSRSTDPIPQELPSWALEAFMYEPVEALAPARKKPGPKPRKADVSTTGSVGTRIRRQASRVRGAGGRFEKVDDQGAGATGHGHD